MARAAPRRSPSAPFSRAWAPSMRPSARPLRPSSGRASRTSQASRSARSGPPRRCWPRAVDSMRAILCREFGSVDKLELAELPAPAIASGSVRVAVHAVGVNFADLLIVQGKYQEKPALPFSPGFEIAGVVTELGPGTEDVRLGERVLGPRG